MNKWLTNEDIVFEPSTLYLQEYNGLVSKQVRRIIMEMTHPTILKRNINNHLWPKVVQAITHVKNIRPTKALKRESQYQALNKEQFDLSHLQILDLQCMFWSTKRSVLSDLKNVPHKLFEKG